MKDDLNEAPTPPVMSGDMAAAILLMLLEDGEAATMLKHFEPDQVRLLGKAMFNVAEAKEADIETALDRFVIGSRSVSSLSVGTENRIRTVMNDALGNVRADNLLAAIAPQASAVALETLRWMDVPTLRRLLIEENPQVGAIILTVLTPDVAGDALSGLDETLQAELVYRAARLTSVPAAAIEDLEAILVQTANAETGQGGMKLGGKSDAAKIVNSLPKALGERVLRSVKKRDRLLAEAIEEEMFVFENLNDLDAKNLGTVLRSVDANALSLALKGADGATTDRFLATMSARAAQTIRDEMSEMEMVKRTDVEDAQRVIIGVARQLAAEGTIIMSGKGDDYV
ncbi:MAG: FliG C-terminal domain-containing protein [Sphingorhabdus sp.]